MRYVRNLFIRPIPCEIGSRNAHTVLVLTAVLTAVLTVLGVSALLDARIDQLPKCSRGTVRVGLDTSCR